MKPLLAKPGGILAPSLLAADFSKLGEEIRSVETAGVDWLHVDVMDGHYVPNLTIGPPVVKSLRPVTALPLDCHLMVTDPGKWIEPFAQAGADIITIHIEACEGRASELLQAIREKGRHPGLSLNPDTELSEIEPFLDEVDLVLVMSVHPGFTGQKFIEASVDKVAALKEMRRNRKKKDGFLIEVDGGVSKSNIEKLSDAGAEVFVAGAAVFFAPDRKIAVQELRKLMR